VKPGRALLVVGCTAVLAATGCYGSTRSADEVAFDGARLNAQGTTNHGPAYSFFEYWPTAFSARVGTTPRREWPGDVSGPFSARVQSLAVNTPYSFRMCGGDEGAAPVCAQTEKFSTAKPGGDLVIGTAAPDVGFRPTVVNATSDASGANPSGTLSLLGQFSGRVTRMTVQGNRAAVFAEGSFILPGGAGQLPGTGCLTVVDGGADAPPGSGDFLSSQFVVSGIGNPPLACELPPPVTTPGPTGAVSVYDG
jgi:hypothetical protein